MSLSLLHGPIQFLPAIHQRMIFADETRRAIAERRPDCIAVELPPALKERVVRGVMLLPRIASVCHPVPGDPGRTLHVPIDPCDAIIEAVRTAIEEDIPLEFIDGGAGPEEHAGARTAPDLPDDWMIERVGLEKYVELTLPYAAPRTPRPSDGRREAWMAARLAQLAREHERILCVLGLAHYEGVLRHWEAVRHESDPPAPPDPPAIEGAFLAHLSEDSLPGVLREIPHLVFCREQQRDELGYGGQHRFDKLEALARALKSAEIAYVKEYKGEISLSRFRGMAQYARNLAFMSGRLQPSAYEMVMAAKSFVDGDYGFELHQLLMGYPFQEEDAGLPRFTVKGDRGFFNDRDGNFRVGTPYDPPASEMVKLVFRRRPPAEMLEAWKKDWGEEGARNICSWPPEDEAQERFMGHVRKRAIELAGAERRQTVEFSTSFLDGLDIRETMRNWHGGKIYVQHAPRPRGEVGAVVMIFEDSSRDALFPWRCTLYAENRNESDISFYATPLGDHVVGPRISRTEFGGILSVYPARGIPDLWRVPALRTFKRCRDRLLAGAILFSEEPYIGHIAADPPSAQMREIASRHGKRIIHMPLHGLSRDRVKKLRMFHILNGREVRNYAADYIFE